MSSNTFSAVASIDKATNGAAAPALVLSVKLSEGEALGLVDTKWYDELCALAASHGGVGINTKEVRVGYDPRSSSHYSSVSKKLQEKFTFDSPR